MILYHGTDSKNLESILKKGLLPRKDTGNQVYSGNLASNENFTYLTWWNPVAHAYTIDENSPCIIKVDVDESDLYPDEDFLERLQFMETGKPADPSSIDITQHKYLWLTSYKRFGNVAIRHVPPEKIVSYAVLDPSDFDYHCGLGAQGNQLIPNIRTQLHFMDSRLPLRYAKRLDLLFTKGWEAVKKDILKERPSLAFCLAKPTEQIRVNGVRLKVLIKPPTLNVTVYICDEWQENCSIKFPVVDKRFSKLVQIPLR